MSRSVDETAYRNLCRSMCGAQGTVAGLGPLGPQLLVVTVVTVLCSILCSAGVATTEGGNVRMRFLVTVNSTWNPRNPDNSTECLTTASTPYLDSDRSINETHPVTIGDCDHGPLVFGVYNGSRDKHSKMDVYLTFYSALSDYSSPPACYIPWNGTYLNPTTGKMDRSPLPSCFTTALVTNMGQKTNTTSDYWFRLLEWEM